MKIRIVSFLAALFLTLLPATALAAFDPLSDVCKQAPQSPTCQQVKAQQVKGTDPIVSTIHEAANIIALIAGAAAVIIIIYSSFMFVTAGGASPGQRSGDPNRIKSARASLTGGIIGLAVIALAWTIVNFVIEKII
jgi:hypothetical protein